MIRQNLPWIPYIFNSPQSRLKNNGVTPVQQFLKLKELYLKSLLLSPFSDLGIGLVWDNLAPGP